MRGKTDPDVGAALRGDNERCRLVCAERRVEGYDEPAPIDLLTSEEFIVLALAVRKIDGSDLEPGVSGLESKARSVQVVPGCNVPLKRYQ